MIELKHLLGPYVSRWNRLTDLVTTRDAIARSKELKALVRTNRLLVQAVSDLNGIHELKFAAAEGLAKIKDDDQEAKVKRQRLWDEIEKASGNQKMRINQSIIDVLATLNQAQEDRQAMAERLLVARAQEAL